MNTLKEIIGVLKIIGISIAGITFIILMLKMATEPEYKEKYIKLTKHLLMATILITVSMSLIDLPKQYYGSKVEIVDDIKTETTIKELKDKDCQNRETINVNGRWYVVTDRGMKIAGLTDNDSLDNVTYVGFYSTGKVVENVCFLRPFSDCQGVTKGLFADIRYYRDSDGLIFSRDCTYPQYQNLKEEQRQKEQKEKEEKEKEEQMKQQTQQQNTNNNGGGQ